MDGKPKQRSPLNKHDRIRGRASELAQSGQYNAWREVEAALVDEGYVAAPKALKSAFWRGVIDWRCEQAKKKAG